MNILIVGSGRAPSCRAIRARNRLALVPELPDVEGFRRIFARKATGKTVRAVRLDARAGRNVTPTALDRALRRRTFDRPARRGKWLIAPAGEWPVLLLHFGMTGDLEWRKCGTEPSPHDRLRLSLTGGELVFRDMRRLGGVWLARDQRELEKLLGRLGPDALEATRSEFLGRLDRRRGSAKAALMDQSVVAGLGNLTVDESLWRARIAPRRYLASLASAERVRLHRSIREVLDASVKVGRVPDPARWLTGARRRGGVCPRCRTSLRRETVAGRTTYWCPSCQK